MFILFEIALSPRQPPGPKRVKGAPTYQSTDPTIPIPDTDIHGRSGV